jgi:hypothetical protein
MDKMGRRRKGNGSGRGPLCDLGALSLVVSFLDGGVFQMGQICNRADIEKNTPRMLGRWGVNGRLTMANGRFSWGSVGGEDYDGCSVVGQGGWGGMERRVNDGNVNDNNNCCGNMFHGVMHMNTDLLLLRGGGVCLRPRSDQGRRPQRRSFPPPPKMVALTRATNVPLPNGTCNAGGGIPSETVSAHADVVVQRCKAWQGDRPRALPGSCQMAPSDHAAEYLRSLLLLDTNNNGGGGGGGDDDEDKDKDEDDKVLLLADDDKTAPSSSGPSPYLASPPCR